MSQGTVTLPRHFPKLGWNWKVQKKGKAALQCRSEDFQTHSLLRIKKALTGALQLLLFLISFYQSLTVKHREEQSQNDSVPSLAVVTVEKLPPTDRDTGRRGISSLSPPDDQIMTLKDERWGTLLTSKRDCLASVCRSGLKNNNSWEVLSSSSQGRGKTYFSSVYPLLLGKAL